jgi:hypothetical protein
VYNANLFDSVVSTPLFLDTNSCRLAVSDQWLPYGLIRSRAACEKRGGSVDRTLSSGLVCCAPETVSSGLALPVPQGDGDDDEPPIDAPLYDEAVARESLEYERRGTSLFWGSPVEVSFTFFVDCMRQCDDPTIFFFCTVAIQIQQ